MYIFNAGFGLIPKATFDDIFTSLIRRRHLMTYLLREIKKNV